MKKRWYIFYVCFCFACMSLVLKIQHDKIKHAAEWEKIYPVLEKYKQSDSIVVYHDDYILYQNKEIKINNSWYATFFKSNIDIICVEDDFIIYSEKIPGNMDVYKLSDDGLVKLFNYNGWLIGSEITFNKPYILCSMDSCKDNFLYDIENNMLKEINRDEYIFMKNNRDLSWHQTGYEDSGYFEKKNDESTEIRTIDESSFENDELFSIMKEYADVAFIHGTAYDNLLYVYIEIWGYSLIYSYDFENDLLTYKSWNSLYLQSGTSVYELNNSNDSFLYRYLKDNS